MSTPADTTPPPVTRVLARTFAFGALGAVACALPALALNRWELALGEGERFVPALARVHDASFALPLLSLVVLLWVLARRAWPALASLSRGQRIGCALGLVLAQLAVLAGVLWALTVTQKNWLFHAPLPVTSLRSPDGLRTAYATSECFLGCSVDVHVREGNALVMRRVQQHPNSRGDHARLLWRSNAVDSIEVLELTTAPGVGGIFMGPR